MGVQFALGRWGGEGGQFDQGFGDAQRLGRMRDSVQQHGELVAANARGDIALARGGDDVLGGAAQQFVAHRMAVAVIDEAEALDVDRQHREPVALVAALLADRARHMLDEQCAVGQAGEPVVEGVVDQSLLGALAQVNVADGARHAHRAPLLVALCDAARQHPAKTAVRLPYAVFQHELARHPAQVCQHLFLVGLDFVRMQVGQDAFRVAGQGARRQAEDLAGAVGKIDGAPRDVPVPQAVVGAAHRQCIALLARLELPGGFLDLADALLQRRRHDVEMAGEDRELVVAVGGEVMVEVPVGDRLAAGQQAAQVVREQVADGRQQHEGERDLHQRDDRALLDDGLACGREDRDRDAELQEADLVAWQQQGPAHVDDLVRRDVFQRPFVGDGGGRQVAQLGHPGAQQGVAVRRNDAHVNQPFIRIAEQFAEDVLEFAVALLVAIRHRHRVQHAGVLADERLQARRGGVVHQPHAVGKQQRQQHDLHCGAGEQQAEADG